MLAPLPLKKLLCFMITDYEYKYYLKMYYSLATKLCLTQIRVYLKGTTIIKNFTKQKPQYIKCIKNQHQLYI